MRKIWLRYLMSFFTLTGNDSRIIFFTEVVIRSLSKSSWFQKES